MVRKDHIPDETPFLCVLGVQGVCGTGDAGGGDIVTGDVTVIVGEGIGVGSGYISAICESVYNCCSRIKDMIRKRERRSVRHRAS